MVIYFKAEGPIPESDNIHFMPCSIDYNGKAAVSSYMIISEGDSKGVKKTSFRGYPLDGCEIDLPTGYLGYVIEKPDSSTTQVYQVQQSFKKINYWNWDRIPSKDDALLSAFDWLDVSEAVHSKTVAGKAKTENDKTVKTATNDE